MKQKRKNSTSLDQVKSYLTYFQSLNAIPWRTLKNKGTATEFQESAPAWTGRSLGPQVSLTISCQPCAASKPQCNLFASLALIPPSRHSGAWLSDCWAHGVEGTAITKHRCTLATQPVSKNEEPGTQKIVMARFCPCLLELRRLQRAQGLVSHGCRRQRRSGAWGGKNKRWAWEGILQYTISLTKQQSSSDGVKPHRAPEGFKLFSKTRQLAWEVRHKDHRADSFKPSSEEWNVQQQS